MMVGIKNKTTNWKEIKNHFDSLKTYKEKLEWWDINIPKPTDYTTYPIQFEYTEPGTPIRRTQTLVGKVKFDQGRLFFESEPSKKTNEFISILPYPLEMDELIQFWEWILPKINIRTIEYFENNYRKKLALTHSFNHPNIIEGFKREIELEKSNHERDDFFQRGRNFAIYNEPKYLFFSDPDTKMGDEIYSLIHFTIRGYENRLNEIGLDQSTKPETRKIPSNQIGIKLNWTGPPTQLYWFFGQVKQREYSDNSFAEMAEFIQNNFNGINAQKSTIKREIQKFCNHEKQPKTKDSIDMKD